MAMKMLGILLVGLGFMIMGNPKYYSAKYHHTFDFTGFNIPFGIFFDHCWMLVYMVGNEGEKEMTREEIK